MNPYFDIAPTHQIASIEELLSLNVQKTYYAPGVNTPPVGYPTSTGILAVARMHSAAGLFRGQLLDWPLVPKCFRGVKEDELDIGDVIRMSKWFQATRQFREFCERAEIQNPSFPSGILDRMSIAQHFGVPTPLLDWSQNIFGALFFAVRDVFGDVDAEVVPGVRIYHVVDEELFSQGVPDRDPLYKFDRSAFVKPYHIDRRIERQRGVFTYHPHPSHRPSRVPVREYLLEWGLVVTIIDLMKGFGFTEDYFFPDYAGIAHAVTSTTSL